MYIGGPEMLADAGSASRTPTFQDNSHDQKIQDSRRTCRAVCDLFNGGSISQNRARGRYLHLYR